jgi:two-component system cell cycle sensor histidine kinase/response regulator CckA
MQSNNEETEHYGLPLSRTLKLLMVEDSPADAELIWAVLKRAGYLLVFNVVSAPADFEDRLQKGDFDVILSDHNLVSWTGMDALEILRRSGKEIPFVVVTATLGDEAAVEYLKRGAADYVLKHRLERLPVIIGQTLREMENRRQKRALLEKIECAKKEWELTFDTVPDAVVLTDSDCHIRRANLAATQVFGLQFSGIIGRDCAQFLSGICKPVLGCRHEQNFTTREQSTSASTEDARVYEPSSIPVLDATGAVQGCVHVVRDITEKCKADDAIRKSEKRYRELVENTTYGVFQSSADGRFLEVNPALVAMLGYSTKEEVLALDLTKDVYRRPSERNDLLRQYRDEIEQTGDLCWMKKDGGTLLLRTSGRAVRNEKGEVQYYEVIAEDITAQRTLEAELRQSQKMEAVGRLAGGIAHDFNNLLAVILGNVDLLLEPTEPPDQFSHRINEIRTATVRAAELTQRLLSFSRRQALDERVFDLNAVVNDTSKLLQRVLGEDIHLQLRLNASPEQIRADQSQVEQAVMNLAVNARDAMPNGGSLIIETSDIELDGTSMGNIRSVAPGEYSVLTFSDTGVGMDDQTKNRIFEPFFTTKEPGKGTGLGLAMVYGFIQQSRGLIHVYSEVGKGTTFRLYFPRVRAKGEVAAAPTPETVEGGSETILLAEDEESLREIVEGVLHSLGYAVIGVNSGSEALKHLHQTPGRVDLLLTDMIMPGMTGRELGDQVKTLRPEIKIIYMSGYAGDVLAKHDPRVPFAGLLHKPFTRKQLAHKLREALDAKSPGSVPAPADPRKVSAA